MSAVNAASTIVRPDFRHVDHWIFDLDNTLYDANSGVFPQIDRNMRAFLMAEFSLPEDQAQAYQKELYRDYGTTLSGLMQRHGLKPERFLHAVHEIDLAELKPDVELREMLARLPGKKAIFTNGSTAHAENVARALGILDAFDAVFDIVRAEYRPKPDPFAYDGVLKHYGAAGTRAAMFEDLKRNLKPAALLGMTTVWIANDQPWMHAGIDDDAHVHHTTHSLTHFLNSIETGDFP